MRHGRCKTDLGKQLEPRRDHQTSQGRTCTRQLPDPPSRCRCKRPRLSNWGRSNQQRINRSLSNTRHDRCSCLGRNSRRTSQSSSRRRCIPQARRMLHGLSNRWRRLRSLLLVLSVELAKLRVQVLGCPWPAYPFSVISKSRLPQSALVHRMRHRQSPHCTDSGRRSNSHDLSSPRDNACARNRHRRNSRRRCICWTCKCRCHCSRPGKARCHNAHPPSLACTRIASSSGCTSHDHHNQQCHKAQRCHRCA